MVVTRKGGYHHDYIIFAAGTCRQFASACLALAAEETLGVSLGVPQALAGALVVLAGLPGFLKPIRYPVPLSLTIGLLVPDLLLRRG